MEEEKLDFS